MAHSRTRPYGRLHPLRRLNAAAFGFFLTLLVFAAHAQTPPKVVTVPYSFDGGTWKSGEYIARETFESNWPGRTQFDSRPVAYAGSTVGSLAKAALRRANAAYTAYQVAKAVIDAAGWAIDELQQQVIEPSIPSDSVPAGTPMYCYSFVAGVTRCTTTAERARYVTETLNPTWAPCPVRSQPNVNNVVLDCAGGQTIVWGKVTFPDAHPDDATGRPQRTIPDTELAQAIMAQNADMRALLTAPNGVIIRTPEVVAAMNALRQAIEAANGIDPGTNEEVDPEYPDNEEEPPPSAWPGFCSWAKVVCDWAQWAKQEANDPNPPELPVQEAGEEVEWNSGQDSGHCPAPYSTPVLDGEFEIRFEGLCGFVEYLRPFLISAAWIVAAVIVAGWSRRNG